MMPSVSDFGHRKAAFRYALYGALFGCCFPIISTVADLHIQHLPCNSTTILAAQGAQPLHWIIDSAPFFLGLFAFLAGRRQDQIFRLNALLEDRVAERTAQLVQSHEQTEEREVLLKEIHHRVKNNLQIISSLLDLQARYIEDAEVLTMFKESRNRIRSMGLIHEKLYQSEDLAWIDFSAYVHSLVDVLVDSYSMGAGTVTFNTQIEVENLDIDTALPCGLIINELVSNALKHAFPDGRGGEIHIRLHARDDGKQVLTVRNNGVSFPADLDFRRTESLGLKLVTSLANQLRASIDLDRSDGTEFSIVFSMPTRS